MAGLVGLDESTRVFPGGNASFLAGKQMLDFLQQQGTVTPEQANRMGSPAASHTVNNGQGQMLSGAQVASQLLQQNSATPEQVSRAGHAVAAQKPTQDMASLAKKAAEVSGLGNAIKNAQNGQGTHAATIAAEKGSDKIRGR